MVTCLVWAAVLVVLVLLILVVFWSMIVGAFPIWPPIAFGLVTFLILTRPRIPEALVRLIATLSVLGLAIDLPTGVPNYFLAMRELGYTGSFGSSLGAVPVDWVRLSNSACLSVPWLGPQSARYWHFAAAHETRCGRT